ncbi:quinohemoprotein amine dehydrogenase subunit beta [Rhodovulum tesquicola]|uniref:quinohemoprotein amine dehydrogenase subunit beta n=1 Tax=Rhodovulum tesquicola TaxID=540254 RepID=UPI0020983D98|nr:quinohemoprotein amine dehydrogenase subunit beta [Rhodovulum tesquicola]MCO8143675.1 quinohemoprotein amine dehydrogenase subunit beta [Rhodovulum tesquicola]
MKTLTALLAPALLAAAAPALARDYLIAPTRPDRLVIVDTEEMAVDKVITIDMAAPLPSLPVVSADGRRAFVIVAQNEEIVEIDLESGEEVQRLILGTEQERVKALFGMDLSPDGTTLAVYESPVGLFKNHFEVRPTRLSLYDAATGALKARAEAPRQVTVIAYSKDGSRIYGMGREMHVFDGATGQKVDELPIHGWGKGEYVQPDVLDAWSQFEVAGMVTTPFYTFREGGDPADPEAYRTGLLTLDLETGEMVMKDAEATDIFYFSTAADPEKRRIFGVYNQLASFDLETRAPIKRVNLPHSYYSVNVSSDGSTVYIGGTLGNIGVYDAETLEKKGQIDLPDGYSMSLASVRLFTRDE